MSKINNRFQQTWNDLAAYKAFCVSHGYKFNEEDLYNMRRYPMQQFNKFRNKKNCKDQWSYDANRLRLNIGDALSYYTK